MKPLSECRLYAFVDTAYLRGRAPDEVAQQLCEGGADLIQLRAKDRSPEEIKAMARAILPITRRANVGLVINDRFALAQELGAELCHLGQEDFFGAGYTHISQLRAAPNHVNTTSDSINSINSVNPQLGLSSHSPDQALRAQAVGAAYVAVGPVYATATKPSAKPVTLEYVRWAASHLEVPWFAIGGINPGNLDDVLAAGATRICVVSAILNEEDVAAACNKLKQRIL